MLSCSSIIWLSPITLNGWFGNALNRSISISTTFSSGSLTSVFSYPASLGVKLLRSSESKALYFESSTSLRSHCRPDVSHDTFWYRYCCFEKLKFFIFRKWAIYVSSALNACQAFDMMFEFRKPCRNKKRDHRQGGDPNYVGIPSCRKPLMYVWFNWPIITAYDLEMDLRSLFHLNHSVVMPHSFSCFRYTPDRQEHRYRYDHACGPFSCWPLRSDICHKSFLLPRLCLHSQWPNGDSWGNIAFQSATSSFHKTIPYLPSCYVGSVCGQCLCLQISDYEYRDPFSHLWAPAVSYRTATVITFYPSVCFLQEKTAIDSAVYRVLHVVCIRQRSLWLLCEEWFLPDASPETFCCNRPCGTPHTLTGSWNSWWCAFSVFQSP